MQADCESNVISAREVHNRPIIIGFFFLKILRELLVLPEFRGGEAVSTWPWLCVRVRVQIHEYKQTCQTVLSAKIRTY